MSNSAIITIGGSGYSGYSGGVGASGFSGYSGLGTSGFSGYLGAGISGFSGYYGLSGFSGYSGPSGFSGYSGSSGFSGYNGIGTSGFSGYSGSSGYSGYSGPFGGNAILFLWNNSTAGGDPGTGKISVDTGTVMYISDTDASSYGTFNWVDYIDESNNTASRGTLKLMAMGDSGSYNTYTITGSAVSGGSYYSIQLSLVSSVGTISNNQNVLLYFTRSGDLGFSGYSGISGRSGYSGYSGQSGYSGYSGPGSSGYSGYAGPGSSGYSGYTGPTPAAASDTAAGIIEIAVQSEMETGTDNTRVIVPGRQQFHLSAAKCWVSSTFNSTSIQESYNVASIEDTATGRMTVNLANAFAAETFCVVYGAEHNSASGTTQTYNIDASSRTTSSYIVESWRVDLTEVLADPTASWFSAAFGDLP